MTVLHKKYLRPAGIILGVLLLPLLVWAAEIAVTKSVIDSDTGSNGGHTSIALGNDGYPVVAYYDDSTDDLIVAKCTLSGCTAATTVTTIDSTDSVGQYTSIAIGNDGYPVISYYDVTNTALKVAKCSNAGCTSGTTLTTVDNTASVGQYTSLAIGSDGFPVISYFDDDDSNLKVAKCNNAGCTAGTTITEVDTTGVTGTFTSIAIGDDNFPVISYFSDRDEGMNVAKCTNSGCTTSTTITTVSGSVPGGTPSSITIGTDGFPVVAYFDSNAADIYIAKCTNSGCTTSTTLTAIDDFGDSSIGFLSIKIGDDDYPVVSYFDTTNTALKVTKCTNSGCTTGNITNTLESAGNNTGKFNSLTLDRQGLPLISYVAQTTAGPFPPPSDGVKVAWCRNPYCGIPAAPTITSHESGATISDTTPTFVGTGSIVGSTIEVSSGSTTLCTATVSSDTTWTCTSGTALEDGATVVITAIEQQGGFDGDETEITLIVDESAASSSSSSVASSTASTASTASSAASNTIVNTTQGVGGGGGGGGGVRSTTLEQRREAAQQRFGELFGTTSSSPTDSEPSDTTGGIGGPSDRGDPLRMNIGGNDVTFQDVYTNDWYGTYVRNVIELNIFEGYKEPDGTPLGIFGPADPITWGQLAKVGTFLGQQPVEGNTIGFEWFFAYLEAARAAQLSVFQEEKDGHGIADRGAVIQTILESLDIPIDGGDLPYVDVPASHPYVAAIATATRLGIVSGDDVEPGAARTFRPNDAINRAEVGKMATIAWFLVH